MINCSHCGTQNRDGSKFCNNCGARLTPVSGLVCPMCSTPNQIESVFCSNCGARLVPLTAASASEKPPETTPIKGLSLPAKSTPSAPEPAPEEAESPDWLARLRANPPTEEEPEGPSQSLPLYPKGESPSAGGDETPEWLARLRAAAPAESSAPAEPSEPTAAEPSPAQADDSPDWLARLRDAPSPAQEEPIAPSEQTAAEASSSEEPPVTDFAARLRAAGPTDESPEQPKETEETSAWLEQAHAEKSDEPAAPSEESELPDWLKQMRAAPTEETPIAPQAEVEQPSWVEPAERAPEPESAQEVPAWVKEADAAPSTPAPQAEEGDFAKSLIESLEAAAPSEAMALEDQPSETEELPDWLKSPQPTSSVEQPPAAPAEEVQQPAWLTEPEKPLEAGEMPDWLRMAMPSEVAASQAAPATPEGAADWLGAFKPGGTTLPPTATGYENEPAEAAGPLAGLRGVLPLAHAVAQPHARQVETPAAAKDGAQIFESILAAPAAPPAAPTAQKKGFVLTARPFIYLLLFVAVFIPFLLPTDLASSALKISGTPAADFYDTIQNLSANSTVLLAFDYDASVAGEMDLQAKAITRHLIQRKVKIIALSTLETGPRLTQRVLDDAAAGAKDYGYGTQYLNLGYLPGNEAGLAQLAAQGLPAGKDFVKNQSVDQFPVAANVKSLRDVALVIELAGSDDPLKNWMEQVQARTNTRIAAGVSAAVEPKAKAYRDAKQLTALVSGLVGAAQYEVLSGQAGLALTSLNAQGVAMIVLVMIVVVGNLAFWISRATARGKVSG